MLGSWERGAVSGSGEEAVRGGSGSTARDVRTTYEPCARLMMCIILWCNGGALVACARATFFPFHSSCHLVFLCAMWSKTVLIWSSSPVRYNSTLSKYSGIHREPVSP